MRIRGMLAFAMVTSIMESRRYGAVKRTLGKAAPSAESVNHDQRAGAVDGVQAEQPGPGRRQQPLDGALDELLGREPHDAAEAQPGAVARSADLRRPVQRADAR